MSAFRTDLQYRIHAPFLTSSSFWVPPSPLLVRNVICGWYVRDRKRDEDAAVGSAENEAEEGEEVSDDDGSLEWAELLLTTATRQAS